MTTQPEALRLADRLGKAITLPSDEIAAAAELRRLHEENERLKEELEDERMRHAACGVVAMSNTRESAERNRKMLPKYWSASVQDVAKAVDREMDYRDRITTLEAALRQAVEAMEQMRAAFLDVDGDHGRLERNAEEAADDAIIAARQALESKA